MEKLSKFEKIERFLTKLDFVTYFIITLVVIKFEKL